MEAMAFQQKCRQQCQGFTYDKQVGTGDKIIFPKCNTCCCGVQSVSLCADQKEQLFHRIDECDTRSKLKICTCDPVETRRCTCFPKPNPNKYGSAKNLVIGERKERCCRDYDIVDQATREADAEAYLCCDCLDMWKKKNEKRRPSCLKKKCECCDEKRNASDELSFSFCGKTLEITEEKTTTLKSLKQPTKQLEIEDISSTIGPPSSQNDNADVVKYINEMKMKRKDQTTTPENAREGIEETDKTDKQSTSVPQAPDVTFEEKTLEKVCPGKNYCLSINKYSADREEITETKAIQAKILCNCCDCKVGNDHVQETCCRGGGPLIAVGQLLSNICSSALETTGRFISYFIGRDPPSSRPFYENPCVVMNRWGCDSGCYDTRLRRYYSEVDRPRNVCPCRMNTNRFCGKTCYDCRTNGWYSCCDPCVDDEKVVRVTFKDTAEKRTIRLENNCRNSRYHVVYE
ncbi:uncharacterized protein LOC123679652 isoform X4 [Harmonia axyridis]|uniref:uncharacterized protein LOC123679652 isoform X4 n=1 Tax=Harmonia axyridis TaxID=115357 RepID=UPI001E274FD5|nr:uncharacterized protein LOC123679652 isoform X4 [Harmonia axyridis]